MVGGEVVPDRDDMAAALADCDVAGPATPEMIADAERQLGVSFPSSYRWFLARYGAAVCKGFCVAGLFEATNEAETPYWPHVVTRTLQLRRAGDGHLPVAYVSISDDGGDYKYYLDTSRQTGEDECPVVVLGPGAEGLVVADEFGVFLKRAFEDNITF
jgi:hypothetical protein